MEDISVKYPYELSTKEEFIKALEDYGRRQRNLMLYDNEQMMKVYNEVLEKSLSSSYKPIDKEMDNWMKKAIKRTMKLYKDAQVCL